MARLPADPENFIRANTALEQPAMVPEFRLWLATEYVPIWQATEAWLEEQNVDPPYWASIALCVAFAYLSARVVPGKAYVPPDGLQVLAHVLYLPVLLHVPLINSVYWTLCLEIQFYLVYALLMVAATALRSASTPWGEGRAFYADSRMKA